jgi:Carboxypeptidase regulatory-like domain
MAAGLAAIPAVASAAAAQPSSPSRAASAGRHAGPQPTALATLEQRARASLHGQVAHASAITGTVLGAFGLPVTGACVTAVGRSGSVTTSAASSGAFTIAGLRAGSYTLEYRDCAAPGLYRAIWSGGAGWQRTAARVLVGADRVRHVPVMMLPGTPAALQSRGATWHRFLANAVGRGLSPAAAAKAGQISGVVTGHGKRLRGMCVVVFSVNGGQGYGATTGKNGSYVVRHVPAGRYDVTFAPWFCQKGNWLQQLYKGHNTPFGFLGGDAVTVRSGKTTKGIDAHLRLGSEISGTVTTRSGRKLGGICVNAEGTVPGGGVGIQLATSGDGSYQLHALFPGKYKVDFTTGCGNNANYAPAALKAIKITYGKHVTARTIVMVPGGVITGTVRLGSSSGTPLAGICVDATNSDGSSFAGDATNAAGRYRLTSLGTQTYQVQFSPGCNNNGNYVGPTKYAHATAGKITGGVNAVMVLGAEISGVVTDIHSHPLSGMCINVSGPSSGNSPYGTLRDGSYFVNQLPAGTYQLGFSTGCNNSGNYAPYWYNNQDDISLATPIKLTRSASLTINAQMQPGASVSGTITDSHGRKLTGICVFAKATTGTGGFRVAFSTNGTYRLAGLAPGRYLVDFGCGISPRYADQWFPNAPDAASAQAISVPAGQTTGISAVLRPAGSITGVVRGPSGRPLPGVCVAAINTTDRASSVTVVIGGGSGQTTNSRGIYRISGLATGRYDVQFTPCLFNSRFASQWYRGQASQLSATPVRVRSGATTAGINATMRIGATVTGRVVISSGKPLKFGCVSAYNPKTGQFGFATTGKTGTYTMRALASGRYTVSFSPCRPAVNLITAERHIKVAAPHTTSGVNARLVPGGSASGVVTAAGSGGPAAFTCVEFISANPANPGGFGFTGADGSYLATGIMPGSYQVLFNDPLCGIGPAGLAPQWYNGQPTQATAAKVMITVGHTTAGINAALQTDGTITGTVRGPLSAALGGICVTAMPLAAGSVPLVAVSGKSGGFTLIDMVPGRYKVEFSSGCGATGYRTQWWQNAGTRQAATVINVAATQTVTGIDATMAR